MDALISIIIPTYNRAPLIGETLDSILAQTYQHWECIVVDDGSTDATQTVMAAYLAKDPRFQYHHRPKNRLPGGNAARNYGLELSRGTYIQWFDSDDLMQPEFLNTKLQAMLPNSVDFVISKSLNFNEHKTFEISKYQGNSSVALTGKNLLLKKVYWMTPDFFVRKESIKDHRFDETLKSGQETNFFLVLLNTLALKGVFIDESLALRRLHPEAIQQQLKESNTKAYQGKLISLLKAYLQVFRHIDRESQAFLQQELMTTLYQLKLSKVPLWLFLRFLWNLIGQRGFIKTMAFLGAMVLQSVFNKGYQLFEYART